MRLALLALLAVASLASAQARAPAGNAALSGVVRDSLGDPIPYANVYVEGGERSTVADTAGFFHLAGVSRGRSVFTARRIGYEPVSFAIEMPPDTTVHVELTLHRTPQLLPGIAALGPRAGLAETGFYDRLLRGAGGVLVTPEAIQRMGAVTRPSSFLARAGGIRVVTPAFRQGTVGVQVPARLRDDPRRASTKRASPDGSKAGTIDLSPSDGDLGGTSIAVRDGATSGETLLSATGGPVIVFLDGVVSRAPIDDVLGVAEVYAIEVYPRITTAPASLQAALREMPRGSTAAVVAIWTTRYRPSRVPQPRGQTTPDTTKGTP